MSTAGLSAVPEVRLDPSSGPRGCEFLRIGVPTFRDACKWVLDLPYGASGTGRQTEILFDERGWTCQSKHDLIAALAQEIEVPVFKYVGAYRLDDSIIEGASVVLARHALPYVPEIHCVLQYANSFVDLTAGNCHGKKKDVTDMDVYFRMEPYAPSLMMQSIYELCVDYYRRIDPRLTSKTIGELRSVAAECRKRTTAQCESAG